MCVCVHFHFFSHLFLFGNKSFLDRDFLRYDVLLRDLIRFIPNLDFQSISSVIAALKKLDHKYTVTHAHTHTHRYTHTYTRVHPSSCTLGQPREHIHTHKCVHTLALTRTRTRTRTGLVFFGHSRMGNETEHVVACGAHVFGSEVETF